MSFEWVEVLSYFSESQNAEFQQKLLKVTFSKTTVFIVKNILIHFINEHIYSCSIETIVLILPSKLLKELEYSKEKKSHFCYSEGKIRLLTENEFTHQKTPKYFNN